jgi:hypothetical protein
MLGSFTTVENDGIAQVGDGCWANRLIVKVSPMKSRSTMEIHRFIVGIQVGKISLRWVVV